MLVCDKPEFVAILPAKTGSRSLHYLLRSMFPIQRFEPHHGVAPEYPEYQKYFTICTSRNPYSRLVSQYHHIQDRMLIPPGSGSKRIRMTEEANEWDFATFTCTYPLEPVSKVIEGARIDYWIHLEKYAQDVKLLPLPKMRSARIPHEHKGPKVDWKTHYEKHPEMIDVVRRDYEQDFDLLGYDTKFPGQLLV